MNRETYHDISAMPENSTLRILYGIDTDAERRAFALGMQAAASKALIAARRDGAANFGNALFAIGGAA